MENPVVQQPYAFIVVIISFPPLVGHTSIITLCGFAYGMKGFYVAAFGSLVGSAISFSLLRFLFKERLHHWLGSNENWKALEEVVVRSMHLI